jgi:putative transposase
MAVGASGAETSWTDFLRGLAHRGLRGAKLVATDAHEGLKAATGRALRATWQRCRVHFMRDATAHAGKTQRRIATAWIGTASAEIDAPAADASGAPSPTGSGPRPAGLMGAAEEDVRAFMDLPREHRAKVHNANPIERLDGEIKRRTDAAGIFPNEAAATRLVGAMLLEQSDEWATQRASYTTLETIGAASDTPAVSLPAMAS